MRQHVRLRLPTGAGLRVVPGEGIAAGGKVMLVKFEQIDLSPIWINPDAVDVVGYRREVLEISAGQHISQIVAGWTEIGMASDSSHGYVVLGTPEEVAEKLFPKKLFPNRPGHGEKFYVPV
jgi:hypothetical protein